MQLVSTGIGADRISDIAANVLKRFLIGYTQRQCAIWDLPIKRGVPVSHVYDEASQGWEDSYEDLPVSPVDESPILLVPRRLVRILPWINYDDFVRTEFSAYLGARRDAARRRRPVSDGGASIATHKAKHDIVTVTRSDITLIERYVRSREQQSAAARPALGYIDEDALPRGRDTEREAWRHSIGSRTSRRIPAPRP